MGKIKMIEELSTWYWVDYKYMITIPLCISISWLAGYYQCKLQQRDKNENIRMRASDDPEDGTLPWMMRKQAD